RARTTGSRGCDGSRFVPLGRVRLAAAPQLFQEFGHVLLVAADAFQLRLGPVVEVLAVGGGLGELLGPLVGLLLQLPTHLELCRRRQVVVGPFSAPSPAAARSARGGR